MRPSTKELLDSIANALDTRVAPTVTDEWAASSLRSIGTLLAHLSVRVELELTILAEGNADLRAVLGEVCERLDGQSTPSNLSIRPEIESLLSRPAPTDPAAVATVAALEEESHALNEKLEQLVHVVHSDRESLGEPVHGEVLASIRGYFARQREREAPLYAALAGPMF